MNKMVFSGLALLMLGGCGNVILGVGYGIGSLLTTKDSYVQQCIIKPVATDAEGNRHIEYWHIDGPRNSSPFWVSKDDADKVYNYCLSDSLEYEGNTIVKDNDVSVWDAKGRLRMRVQYHNGLRDGLLQQWFANGQMSRQRQYVNGVPLGPQASWYENGDKETEGDFGLTTGQETFWYRATKEGTAYRDVTYVINNGVTTTTTKEYDAQGKRLSTMVYEGSKLVRWDHDD